VTLVGDEGHPPYQRPPLSKQYLAGAVGLDRVYLRPADWYSGQGVEWIGGRRALAINREARMVELDDGRTLEYSMLVLATGARPRLLPLPGAELAGVLTLRGIEDANRLRERFAPGKRLVLIGGGYIGLEVAATARKRGLQVTVLEADARVLSRVAAQAISKFFEDTHRAHGVELRTGVTITGIESVAGDLALRLKGGETIPADLVVVGIGVVPNVELAAQAGLAIDNGIAVDEYARTAHPDIFAIGDCASFPSAVYGRRVRLESVQNASSQARVAAMTLAGKPQPYDEVPSFWSEQYDVRLNIVGLSQGYDETVLRGEPASGRFAVFYLKERRLLAVDAVSSPAEFVQSKKLIAARASVSSTALANPAVPVPETVV
jgi:3-phenylpropionate/trans-cinnamate dioxygenase ferredoxin reductase subunit